MTSVIILVFCLCQLAQMVFTCFLGGILLCFLFQASLKILRIDEKLSRGWGGENAYHVAGYRYLLVDGDRHLSRASPPGKVTTLTKVIYIKLRASCRANSWTLLLD